MLFKLFKNWNILTQANKVGISKFIAMQSAKNYATSSAIGILMIPNGHEEDSASYVKVGMAFQRLWLTAASLGLSLQPLAALPYLANRVKAGDAGELTSPHASEVVDAQSHIMELFGNPPGTVAMIFRIGYAEAPSAHSKKSEPGILYLA
jgi:Nitroreductase family